MKSRTKEKGSAAHIVIVVVLVVALLGALGFIFWQNFMKQGSPAKSTETETTQQTESEQVAGEAYKGTRVSAIDGTYSIKIPNGWKVTRNTDDPSNIQQTMGPDELAYDESKAPVIKDDLIGGHDALIFFTAVQDGDRPTYGDETITEFTTDSGLVGKKTERFAPANDEGNLYSEVDVYSYEWVFSKKSEQFVYVFWGRVYDPGVKPDSTFLQLLDDVARSVEIR